MKFVVLGAGALGSVYAAYLARAGEKVALIARGERAKFLTPHGVTITGLEDFTVPVEIIDDPQSLRSADVLILAVKTYSTAEAIASVRHMDVASVFSVQNGVLKNQQLAEAFGAAAVLGAVTVIPAAIEENGAASYLMANPTTIGELQGGISPRVEEIVRRFNNAKLVTTASENILSEEWSKFAGWLGIATLGLATHQETWKFVADPGAARLIARVTREAAQIPHHLGIPLQPGGFMNLDILTDGDEDAATTWMRQRGEDVGKTSPSYRPSIAQDVLMGKTLEVEETFGHAVGLASEYGLSVPTLETCYLLLSAINRLPHGARRDI